ncbi:MAG: hypothetical protein MJ247_05195 [Alphaproteobacteria bacterium]|nr:hypothetical protein [Alphaproteobacteria bacterium]
MKNIFYVLILMFVALSLSSCFRNKYNVDTYQVTDSYNEVYRNKKTPFDMKRNVPRLMHKEETK